MVRGKVKLAYISNDAARRATLKKRRRGMMKKLDELTTLCGVEACAIVYEPKPNDSQPPEIWPSQRGVQRVLSRFSRLSKFNRTNKMLDQQSYLKERIKKAKEQLMKMRRENREKEMTFRMNEYVQSGKLPDNLSLIDLNDLAYLVDQKMREIDRRLEELKRNDEQMMKKKKKMTMNDFAPSSSVPALEKRKAYVLVEDANGLMIVDAFHKQ